jgi:hypothetical protein
MAARHGIVTAPLNGEPLNVQMARRGLLPSDILAEYAAIEIAFINRVEKQNGRSRDS